MIQATANQEDAATGLRLASLVNSGNSAAESELVRHYEKGVLVILRHITGDSELARDLCQDTFLIVLKRLRSGPLDDASRLGGFIAQTARNLAIAEQRRGARRRTAADSEAVDAAPDEGPSREQLSETDSSANAVRKLLLGLKSQRDRAAIVRYYLDEESKESICADLSLTESQFNLVLFRARDRLKQLFHEGGFAKSDLLSLVFL